MNFYVRNGACFDTYDWSSVYDLCRLRIDSDAAVVRFKFGSQVAYDEAYMDLIDSNHIQDIAKYYMEVHGLSQISYHYGVIDNMKTYTSCSDGFSSDVSVDDKERYKYITKRSD